MKRAASLALRPFRERDPLLPSLLRFPDEFSSLFDSPALRDFFESHDAVASTAVDVKETQDKFQFIADMPGLKKEEVKVKVEPGNVLAIEGERTREEASETGTYHRVERSVGRFLRRFRLPENVDLEHVKAKCENGVLCVEVPKTSPEEPHQEQGKEVKIE